MNIGERDFNRCTRHPAQNFTGFCSSCLLERLSAIEEADRNLRNSCGRSERRTLQSLFLLDDQENDSMSIKLISQSSGSGSIPPREPVFLKDCRNEGIDSGRWKNSSLRRRQSGIGDEDWSEIELKSRYPGGSNPSHNPARRSWDGFMEGKILSEDRDSDSSWASDRRTAKKSSFLDHCSKKTPRLRRSVTLKWIKPWRWSSDDSKRDDGSSAGNLNCVENRKESRFGRSKSSNFFSPGKLENGVLPFYLTPLRGSRTAKKRMNSPNSGWGLFGFNFRRN